MSAHIERLRAAVGHEIGESPAETAIREAREEIGADIRLKKLLDVLGGPDYEVTYPNGDRVAYVTSVYEAEVIAGVPGTAVIKSRTWPGPSDRSRTRPRSPRAHGL